MRKEAKSVFSVLILVLVISLFLTVSVSAVEDTEEESIWRKIADFFRNLFGEEEIPSDEILLSPPPSAPTNVIASDVMRDGTPRCGAVQLFWEAPPEPNIVEYFVYRNGIFVGRSNGAARADTVNLIGSTTYTYQVSAVDEMGLESELSLPVEYTTFPCHLTNRIGELNIAVVLVKFTDFPDEPYDLAYTNDRIFTYEYSLKNFINENSYGRQQIIGQSYGWYELSGPATDYCITQHESGEYSSCNVNTIGDEALELLSGDVDITSIDRFIIVINGMRTTGGSATPRHYFSATRGFKLYTIAHEMGHGFEGLHAGGWFCDLAAGPNYQDVNEGCIVGRYSDDFDPMGVAGHQYNAYSKEKMGYLLPEQISTAGQTGEYLIDVLETPSIGIKQLRIPLEGNYFYFLEYRKPIGFDSLTAADVAGIEWLDINPYFDVLQGVQIRLHRDSMYAPSREFQTDAETLRLQSLITPSNDFYDPYRDISVQVIEELDNQVRVLVTIPEIQCTTDAECDDGLFCNGLETCNLETNTCEVSIPPNVDDGVSCTVDSCDEVDDIIVHNPVDSICDNNLFCDGNEWCDPVLDCQPGAIPCVDDEICIESQDQCSSASTISVSEIFVEGLGCSSGYIPTNPGSTLFYATSDYSTNFRDFGGALHFTLESEIPDGATITSAILGMYMTGNNGDCTLVDPHYFFPRTSLVCETIYDYEDMGVLPQGLYASYPQSAPGQDTCDIGWKTFDVTDVISSGTSEVYIEMRGEDIMGQPNAYRKWRITNNPPTLEINYTLGEPEAECTINADCDDGLFCNGQELCVDNQCQSGTEPDCSDGVSCTVDTCDFNSDSCDSIPDDSACNDGVSCTIDSCDTTNGCETTPDNSQCEDSNVCTTNQCTTEGCDFPSLPNDTPCPGGSCQEGICESVDTTPPPTPTLQFPTDQSTAAIPIDFDWTPVSDPSGVTYRIQVDETSLFLDPVEIDVSGLTSSDYQATLDLDPGTYYWHVKAIDESTPPNEGTWTNVWSFEIQGASSTCTTISEGGHLKNGNPDDDHTYPISAGLLTTSTSFTGGGPSNTLKVEIIQNENVIAQQTSNSPVILNANVQEGDVTIILTRVNKNLAYNLQGVCP